MHVNISVTVHAEELRPWTRYVFLVFAVDKRQPWSDI